MTERAERLGTAVAQFALALLSEFLLDALSVASGLVLGGVAEPGSFQPQENPNADLRNKLIAGGAGLILEDISGPYLKRLSLIRILREDHAYIGARAEVSRALLTTISSSEQRAPLVSRSGVLLGMVSTYWRHPHDLSRPTTGCGSHRAPVGRGVQ
jgi:hypothetical protein